MNEHEATHGDGCVCHPQTMPTTPTGRGLFLERELRQIGDPCESLLLYASTVAKIEAEARAQALKEHE